MHKQLGLSALSVAVGLSLASPSALVHADPGKPGSRAERLSRLTQEDEKLISDIGHFLGKTRNKNSGQLGIVAEQVIDYIAVPSEPFVIRLPDGNWLASGNLPHSGDDQGAVLLDQAGAVKGAALVELVSFTETERFHEVWIYVADDRFADAYVADIKKWPAISPKFGLKVFKIGRAK
jgi:hypothetical protein